MPLELPIKLKRLKFSKVINEDVITLGKEYEVYSKEYTMSGFKGDTHEPVEIPIIDACFIDDNGKEQCQAIAVTEAGIKLGFWKK